MKAFFRPIITRAILRFALIPVLMVLSGDLLRSQNVIGFGLSGFSGMPDTVYSGTQLPVAAYVKNYSFFNYQDTLRVDGYIDTGSAIVPISFPPVDSVSILAGDSIPFILPFDFRDSVMGGLFRIGGNVIVVWPAVYNTLFSTGDSLFATVFILDSLNSSGPQLQEVIDVRCYPVPASGLLYITSRNQNYTPEKVTVSNSLGQVLLVTDQIAAGINTEQWPPGIYVLDVQFDNGSKHIYKISKR